MENNKDTSIEGTGTEGRTFTQEDVNRIVSKRVAELKEKGNDEVIKRMAELDARERRMNAIDELRKNNLPDYLVDALNMNTDEDFQKSLDAIKKMKGETGTGQQQNGIAPGTVILGRGNPIGIIGKNTDDGVREAFGLR